MTLWMKRETAERIARWIGWAVFGQALAVWAVQLSTMAAAIFYAGAGAPRHLSGPVALVALLSAAWLWLAPRARATIRLSALAEEERRDRALERKHERRFAAFDAMKAAAQKACETFPIAQLRDELERQPAQQHVMVYRPDLMFLLADASKARASIASHARLRAFVRTLPPELVQRALVAGLLTQDDLREDGGYR